MIDPVHYLAFSSMLMMIGVYGVITNRNAIVVLMSIEIMLTAANVNLVGFSSFYSDLDGQIFALFVISIAAAEVAIALAVFLSLYNPTDTIELALLNRLRC